MASCTFVHPLRKVSPILRGVLKEKTSWRRGSPTFRRQERAQCRCPVYPGHIRQHGSLQEESCRDGDSANVPSLLSFMMASRDSLLYPPDAVEGVARPSRWKPRVRNAQRTTTAEEAARESTGQPGISGGEDDAENSPRRRETIPMTGPCPRGTLLPRTGQYGQENECPEEIHVTRPSVLPPVSRGPDTPAFEGRHLGENFCRCLHDGNGQRRASPSPSRMSRSRRGSASRNRSMCSCPTSTDLWEQIM